jgi:hypothetical protein
MFYTLKLTRDVRTILVKDYDSESFQIVYSALDLTLPPIKFPDGSKVLKSTAASLTAVIPKSQFDKFLMTMILEEDWVEKPYKPSSTLAGYSHTHVGYHNPDKLKVAQHYYDYDGTSKSEYIHYSPSEEFIYDEPVESPMLSKAKSSYLYIDPSKITVKNFLDKYKNIKISVI